MNKDLIQSRFSKNLANYDKNAKIQKRMAEKLITFCNKKSYSKILEIGCGTGFLTKIILENLNFEKYKAIDIVENCRKYIEPLDSRIIFESNDIEDFLKTSDEKFDLIISNASLQWTEDFKGVINSLKTYLKPKGELVFSTFGKENFREISFLSNTGLNYFSADELKNLFESNTEEEIHIMAFNNPKEVLKHLKLTGVNAVENKVWTKKDLLEFENGYINLCSSRPTLTYNPIYVSYISN